MMDFTQQIEAIEEEIRKTPYHKGTEHHIGKLRARLAKLRDREIEVFSKKSGGGGGYAIKKEGDATIVLVGPPSVGKSTLINKLTNAQSKVAPYAFTTVRVIPGMLFYHDAMIQIFDLPGLIQGAKEGKGRGREVLAVIRNADLIVILVDPPTIKLLPLIENELEKAGVRINQEKPKVAIEKKIEGGVILRSNVKQPLTEATIKAVAGEMGIKNAEITLKEKLSLGKLIDAFSTNRVYLPAIKVINKVDLIRKTSPGDSSILAISAAKDIGLEALKEALWKHTGLVRIYLVHADEEPSQKYPFICRDGETLKNVAQKIGSDFAERVKSAKIWGEEARFPGQEVSLNTKAVENLAVRFV